MQNDEPCKTKSGETELTAYHKACQKYVNKFCFHNSFFFKTILLI
jgi:hypothetical protein